MSNRVNRFGGPALAAVYDSRSSTEDSSFGHGKKVDGWKDATECSVVCLEAGQRWKIDILF